MSNRKNRLLYTLWTALQEQKLTIEIWILQNFQLNKTTVNFLHKISFRDQTHKNYLIFSCKLVIKKTNRQIEVKTVLKSMEYQIWNGVFWILQKKMKKKYHLQKIHLK